ncbi:hypothetical protein An01g10430 [Aspergillus niger]|uniref:Uncharacterized protein n=2 Tax=Aspergillus niger TaxID=5061 RepID=A2QA72_ASPNC|nr:hypothetical protein An01g10430 [Aspergillus niger]CAK37224.1 hypothetical protein An01g10430 [Aspergillus niger]
MKETEISRPLAILVSSAAEIEIPFSCLEND